MKEETKRKIGIVIAASVFMMGVWGILKRKDPIEKNIGNVYISDGVTETAIKGHKIEIERNGKKSEFDYPSIKEEADRLCKINASSGNEDKMKISYNKEYYAVEYNIYDSDFNDVSVNQTSMVIPADREKQYYVSITVTWGSEKEYVKMNYYFSIQT